MRIALRQFAGALFFCSIVAPDVAPTRAKTTQSIEKSRLFEPWGTSLLGLIPAEITTRRRVSCAAARRAHLLACVGVGFACAYVRGYRPRITRAYVHVWARTHPPPPPPPVGGGVGSKHQAPSWEPTFTLYFSRKSAPKKPIFLLLTIGECAFFLSDHRRDRPRKRKRQTITTSFRTVAAPAYRN